MKNELYKKLSNYNLYDAIKFEENDRQFLALKDLWENILKSEGSLDEKVFFYLSLILGNSLICYQLSGKGEDYWTEFSEFFGDKFSEDNSEIGNICKLLGEFLKDCKKNRRYTQTKLGRILKFEPFLYNFVGNERYFYENMLDLRDNLAKIMNQNKDAKTIVFAVKMFSYGARNVFGLKYFSEDLYIPIDSRLTKLFERYQGDYQSIEKFYIDLSSSLGIPMMHLDGIIWTSFDELMK